MWRPWCAFCKKYLNCFLNFNAKTSLYGNPAMVDRIVLNRFCLLDKMLFLIEDLIVYLKPKLIWLQLIVTMARIAWYLWLPVVFFFVFSHLPFDGPWFLFNVWARWNVGRARNQFSRVASSEICTRGHAVATTVWLRFHVVLKFPHIKSTKIASLASVSVASDLSLLETERHAKKRQNSGIWLNNSVPCSANLLYQVKYLSSVQF